ncbi:hypothetical protein CMT42_15530 [Elizabethkingia anophelis]|uniref:Uncharacterized protein n=1 Tax=Elizabethkingia anophelis TaxID=1117645 RepID=A0A494J1S9_9FLAO|nr:hypothetical protein [Elizabethkingia anophelis]AQX52511.1 hypothetical protein AYC66_18310 [Elizabethkingia anophelis]MDV3917870.1 hypothetical protein [Elizabethkingia anophelis]MDV3920581.1 hypothetical protein [Elizabethkingia anophelis]MDV3934944.1 hypothetical protein [Elizabethkingia anophelis]MDV3992890.1 hypothetical protein [Elizabethkingia anophelis]
MADINGGEIKYTASLDIEALKKALKDGEGNILGFTDVVEKSGKTIDDVFDATKENISIQKEVIAELESQYKALQKQIENMAPGKAKLAVMGEAAGIAKDIEAEKKALTELEERVKSNAQEHESLRSKLTKAKNEMAELIDKGQKNSAQYEELKRKAKEYQNALKEVEDEMNAIAGSRALDVLIGTMGIASGVLSTGAGAMALFGAESENLEKIMVKLQAVMAVAIGVQQIANTLNKEGALIQGIVALQAMARSRAEALATKGTWSAVVAQKAYNLVASANPYVLLAVAITTLVGALYLMSKASDRAKTDQEELNKAMQDSISDAAKELTQLELLYRTAINDKLSREQRLAATNDLIAAYPGLFSNIEQEIIMNGKAEAAYLAVKAAILEKAKAQAAEKVLGDRFDAHVKKQEEARQKLNEAWERREQLKGKNPNEITVVRSGGNKLNQIIKGGRAGDLFKENTKEIQGYIKDVKDQETEFNKANKAIIDIATESKAAYFKAVTPPAPGKGTRPWYEQQITDLEKARDKMVVGSKEYIKKTAEIKALRDILNPPKPKKDRKPRERQIAEIFPEGTIPDLKRKADLYQEAIDKVVDGKVKLQKLDQFGQSKDKKGNPYYTGEVVSLEEAMKRRDAVIEQKNALEREVEYKNIMDRVSTNSKLWEQYYDAINKIGIDKAKELYKGLLDQDKTYYDYLKKTQDNLLKIPVEKLSPEQKDALQTVTNAMDTMTGKIQPVEKFNNELEQTLSTFTTTAEKIQYLQKIVDENNNSEGYSNGKYSSALARLNDEKRNLTTAYNDMYAQFKQDYQNFEVQKTQIAERWARIRSTIESRFNNGEIDNAEKLRQLNNAGQAEAEEYSKGFMDKLSNNPNYQKAFANIGTLSIKDLKNVRNKLQQELELLRKSGKGTPEAIEAIKRKIQEFDYITGNKNPFEIFKDAIKALGDESVSTEDKLWKLGEAGAALSGFSNLFKSTINDIKGAAEDLGFSLDNEFGDILDKMQNMMEGFDQIGQGMQQFATGGPVGMVTGSIKMIGGLIKSISGWFNNDKKKERQIKAWANEVNNLKNAYADLEQQIKKALGEDVYKKQQEEITNLRRQQQLIQQMSAKEADKKKKDQGKIDDYNRQIQDINRQIEDIQNSITERVLQTTAKDAAKQLGDILVDNFGRAEDAAKSLEDYTNTIFKNIVKNALSMRLEEKMQPVLDDMLKAVGFDKEGKGTFKPLSKEQYDEFKKKIADVAKYGQDVAGMFSDMFDNITIQDPKGLEGAVKTISSQEAGELVAQFNASRIIHGKQLEVMLQNQPTFKDMLAQLVAIEFNTRRLHKMADDIADLNRKITKGSDLFMSGL